MIASAPPSASPKASSTEPRGAAHQRRRLAREDWFSAAQDMLLYEGVEALRIDRLCQALEVTKGSFYWHFKSRADFIEGFLDDWRARATLNIIQSLSTQNLSARTRLAQLFSLHGHPNAPMAARVEQSIRSWARQDGIAREALREVDRIRHDFLSDIFRELGWPEDSAQTRAHLSYTIMLGGSILGISEVELDREAMINEALRLLER